MALRAYQREYKRYIAPGPGTPGPSSRAPVRIGAREDESTQAKFICNQAQNYKCKPVYSMKSNIFLNLSVVAVLSIF